MTDARLQAVEELLAYLKQDHRRLKAAPEMMSLVLNEDDRDLLCHALVSLLALNDSWQRQSRKEARS